MTLEDLGAQVGGIHDLVRLNAWLRERIAAYGFTTHAGGTLEASGGSNFLLLDWPLAWLELYAARGFGAEDCTIPLALADPTPFTWTEVQRRQPGASARVFAAAAEFGWHDGLVVPVHRDDGSRGMIVLAAPRLDLTVETRDEVVAVSHLAFERALMIGDHRSGSALGLTARQQSALRLVATGLTDDEVAEALGVTRATAAFHLQAAKARLGAKTRTQAVAIALTRGLISRG